MNDTLSALDGAFLELEQTDEGALMGIGGVLVFDPLPDGGAPAVEDICDYLAERLGSLPRFSQRLSSTRTGGLAWPRWRPDEHFTVRSHVTPVALPAPGADAELCEWDATFFAQRLDRTRALWEAAVVQGLDGNGWALALKAHHAMLDGVGLARAVDLLLDPAPEASPAEASPAKASPPPEAPPTEAPPPAALPSESRIPSPASVAAPLRATSAWLPVPQPMRQAAGAALHTATAALHAARHPGHALVVGRAVGRLARADVAGAAPTSLNGSIGAHRRYAVVRVPLSDLKAIGHALGGSVNDAVLAACTTGLRELLLSRGETPPRQGLKAMVPVNLRSSEDDGLGNRVSSMFPTLPVSEPSAPARLRKIVAATTELKSSDAGQAASALLDVAALSPPAVHRWLARSFSGARAFNLTITNVPGAPAPRYIMGARLREVHPVVPLAADHTIGVAISSYAGLATIGIIADADSAPDLDVLALGIEAGIDQLRPLISNGDRVGRKHETAG